MQCIILAGGLGTRIRARGGGTPKALIPVLGKPFVFYQLEWLARQDVHRVVLSLGYGAGAIANTVGDGHRWGLSVAYADEGTMLRGTGGALRFVADLGLLDRAFFVLYGDSYLPIPLRPLWQTSGGGRFPTMTVMRNAGRWDRSNVVIRNGELILYDKFALDPDAAGMAYIDYGVSVLNRDVIMDEVPAGEVVDLGHVLHRLSLRGALKSHEVVERFYEVGSPGGLDEFEAYVRAHPNLSP